MGLVSQLPQFQRLGLADWDRFVVGGPRNPPRLACSTSACGWPHESRDRPWAALSNSAAKNWKTIDRRIRPGTILGVGDDDRRLGRRRRAAGRNAPSGHRPAGPRHGGVCRGRKARPSGGGQRGLDRAAGGCVASAGKLGELEKLLNVDRLECSQLPLHTPCADMVTAHGVCLLLFLPASSLYAIAALEAGYSYINFTPSLGAAPAAIDELARLRGTRHYGCDGKTGETLMKSVLAPMFARRNLQVMSWVGHNIFGNMDGQVLNDPANKQTKVASKDHLVGEILGYRPQTLVSIEYLPDLGDWKTAWDHIHFAGFLGVPMTLQFIWQGCDSLLAAPLVLGPGAVHRVGLAPRPRRADALSGQFFQESLRRERAPFRPAVSRCWKTGPENVNRCRPANDHNH